MADTRPQVFIESAALDIGWRDETLNLSELIFRTVRRAIDESVEGIHGIESVVLAAHDLVDGRSLSSMVTAPAAGAYLRDEIRYGDDGAAAFAAAVVRIEAGECSRSIVAAWGRSSEHDVDEVSRRLFDPLFHGPLGLDELQVSAMRAQAWAQAGGRRQDHAQAIARRRGAAASNPRAVRGPTRPVAGPYPLTTGDLPASADVVAWRERLALHDDAVVATGHEGGTALASRRKTGWYPEELGTGWVDRITPALLAFTTVSGTAPTAVAPIRAKEALSRLMRCSPWVALEADLADEHLGLMSRVATQARAFDVTLGRDLFDRPGLLLELIA